MIHISQIVRKWCEDNSTEANNNEEKDQKSTEFNVAARELLKKASVHCESTREASKKKFSELLSQLSEGAEETKEVGSHSRRDFRSERSYTPSSNRREREKEREKEKEEDFRSLEEDLGTVLQKQTKTRQASRGDDWDNDLQEFTKGLFEESSEEDTKSFSTDISPENSTNTDDFDAEEKDENKYVKEEVKEQQEQRDNRRGRGPRSYQKPSSDTNYQKPSSDTNYQKPSSDTNVPHRENEHLNIENVLKSMKTSKSTDRSERSDRSDRSDRSPKKRSPRKSDKDKKNSRHKWV